MEKRSILRMMNLKCMNVRLLLLVTSTISLTACQLLENKSAQPVPPAPATATAGLPAKTPASAGSQFPADATLTAVPPVNASTFPNPDAYVWATVLSGLERPVDLQDAGDGSGRLFVIEKNGRIRIVQAGQLFDFPFLDISDRVGSGSNEQGLLGLAFHPRYVENGLFFVNYTDQNGNTVIARYQVSENPNVADPSSEVVLLRVIQPYPDHNGGVLTFGPDGCLYAGLGDGGAAGDPLGNAQRPDALLGKILRLDVGSIEPYTIPEDNPFRNEIWAYGLRNPWRMSFDRLTGDLFIDDVEQDQWEEIDFIAAGVSGDLNFGWDYYEGTHTFEGTPPQGAQFIAPVAEYDHSQGCSVTGGYVYRGSLQEWQGIYLYADYCRGTVWGLLRSDEGWKSTVLFETGVTVTSFGQDEAGEVYLVNDSGQILRLSSR
jgi:glucose/arabinose dehydrogenase